VPNGPQFTGQRTSEIFDFVQLRENNKMREYAGDNTLRAWKLKLWL